jgi:hypothetical protein
MNLPEQHSQFFQELPIPSESELSGFSALVQAFAVPAPVRAPAAVAKHHVKGGIRENNGFVLYDKRYAPANTLEGHLSFALKHESFDPLVLKRVLDAVPEEAIADLIRTGQSKSVVRRIWFFFELFSGRLLDIPDAAAGAFVDALDSDQYYTAREGVLSRRHRVRNNLLGNKDFLPTIRKTATLAGFVNDELSELSQNVMDRVSNELIARAASFFVLADTKSSFAIEGETPPRNRLERWARAVQQSGKYPLTVNEIERLYNILIEDRRFIPAGLRSEMVYIGERHNNEPLPEFIPAKPEDIPSLLNGLVQVHSQLITGNLDPVLHATAIAFGFVYIHPLFDGNGRLHRCLIHHVLAERGFTPADIIFPISSVIAKRESAYRASLRAHSSRLMPFIDWKPNLKGNVDVVNDTADLYRYFDCTEQAEFLYSCVKEAVEVEVPREIDYLRRYDQAKTSMMNIVELPDRKAEDFIQFMRQNEWRLPNRRRKDEFAPLTDQEVQSLEQAVKQAFEVS